MKRTKYPIHPDFKAWTNMNPPLNRAMLPIRNIGFSYHGETEMFLKILNAFDWDFCQIRYNYLDEHSQAGRRGLRAAAGEGVPAIVMEPLRGGKLADLPGKAKEADRALRPPPYKIGINTARKILIR